MADLRARTFAVSGPPRASLLLALVWSARPLRAEDWPQFRGPTGQGHSAEAGLPLEWSESQNVVWKTPVPGRGWSSPVVAGGRVWLTTSVSEKGASLRALAFDVDTGREAVNVEVFRLRSADLTEPQEQPRVADADRRRRPRLRAFRRRRHGGADDRRARSSGRRGCPYESQHGNGGSPVLYGDLLIFSCDGSDEAFVVALDKRTGKVRWKTSRRQPWDQAYSTPLVIRVGDRDQAGQRRRLSRRRLRSADRARKSGASATPTASPTCRGRCSATASSTSRPGFSSRRCWRCAPDGTRRRDEDARRLDAAARRAADAVAAPRRRRALHRQRRRHRLVPRRDDRRRRTGSSGSAATSRRRRCSPTAGSTS